MSPTVSVAMATYNGQDYVCEQLDSILQQSVCPNQIVVRDDASIDETYAVIHDTLGDAPLDVQIEQNAKQAGVLQNFERALGACTGDIVFLADQDDVWLPTKIEVMAEALQRPGVCLAIHDMHVCNADLERIGETKLERNAKYSEPMFGYTVGMATAVTAPFLRVCLPYPSGPGIAHDSWLHLCAATVGLKHVEPQVLALFRRHATNASSATTVANRPEVSTRWHFFSAKVGASTVENLHKHHNQYVSLERWLTSKRTALIKEIGLAPEVVDAARERTRTRVRWIVYRLELLALPRWKRTVRGLIMWARGGYAQFSGFKSLVKDAAIN